MALLIPLNRLRRLHAVAVRVGLERDALVDALTLQCVAHLPTRQTRSAQIHCDLNCLNRIVEREHGEFPLETWMLTALTLLWSKREKSRVSKVLAWLYASLKKNLGLRLLV